MDIKAKIAEIVQKLQNDKNLMQDWKKNPAAVIEKYAGIDLPDETVNQIVDGIEAKLKLDQIGGALSGLFGKK